MTAKQLAGQHGIKGLAGSCIPTLSPWVSVPTAPFTRAPSFAATMLCCRHPQRSWWQEINCKQILVFISSK